MYTVGIIYVDNGIGTFVVGKVLQTMYECCTSDTPGYIDEVLEEIFLGEVSDRGIKEFIEKNKHKYDGISVHIV